MIKFPQTPLIGKINHQQLFNLLRELASFGATLEKIIVFPLKNSKYRKFSSTSTLLRTLSHPTKKANCRVRNIG